MQCVRNKGHDFAAGHPAAAPLFPVFLKLADRPVVIVGGGSVATAKLSALLDAGAQVTVVAPEVTPEIAGSGVTTRRRPFEASDLDDAWLAVAAAPRAVNRAVAAAAEEPAAAARPAGLSYGRGRGGAARAPQAVAAGDLDNFF